MSILLFVQNSDDIRQIMFSIRDLYELRRETKGEQRFWNQFWHRWECKSYTEAYLQAMIDIARDNNKISQIEYQFAWSKRKIANFERFVATDQYRFCQILENLLYLSDE